jgi:hypothetical protein
MHDWHAAGWTRRACLLPGRLRVRPADHYQATTSRFMAPLQKVLLGMCSAWCLTARSAGDEAQRRPHHTVPSKGESPDHGCVQPSAAGPLIGRERRLAVIPVHCQPRSSTLMAARFLFVAAFRAPVLFCHRRV